MTHRRRVGLIGVMVLAVASGALATPSVAWPSYCSDEAVMFREETPDSGYGTTNRIYVRNRSLDASCVGNEGLTPESHSTAHMEGAYPRFTEVGWVERIGISGSHHYNAFWELHDASSTVGGFDHGDNIGCCGWYRFRVEYVSGTGWKFYYDPGSGFVAIGGVQHAGFSQGTMEGETGRRPAGTSSNPSGTGLLDHHDNLAFRASPGSSYQDWNNNAARTSAIAGWYWDRVAADEFRVCKNGDTCTGA